MNTERYYHSLLLCLVRRFTHRSHVRTHPCLALALVVIATGLSVQSQCNAQGDALSLSSGSGAAGSNVALNLSLASPTGSEPAAVEFSVNYPSDQMASFTAVAGSAATAAGKSLTCSGQTCLLYGLNNQILQNGVVAVLSFQTTANASGNLVVQLTTIRERRLWRLRSP